MNIDDNAHIKKDTIRKDVRTRIKQLAKDERIEQDIRLKNNFLELFLDILDECEEQIPTVLTYMPLPDEPDISTILESFTNINLALPISLDDGKLSIRLRSSKLKTGMFGITEPSSDSTVLEYNKIDFAIIPGRAFGTSGQRLGRGKGYYDRFLTLSNCLTFGLCYDEQIFENIPMEPHDNYINYIITPTETYCCDI